LSQNKKQINEDNLLQTCREMLKNCVSISNQNRAYYNQTNYHYQNTYQRARNGAHKGSSQRQRFDAYKLEQELKQELKQGCILIKSKINEMFITCKRMENYLKNYDFRNQGHCGNDNNENSNLDCTLTTTSSTAQASTSSNEFLMQIPYESMSYSTFNCDQFGTFDNNCQLCNNKVGNNINVLDIGDTQNKNAYETRDTKNTYETRDSKNPNNTNGILNNHNNISNNNNINNNHNISNRNISIVKSDDNAPNVSDVSNKDVNTLNWMENDINNLYWVSNFFNPEFYQEQNLNLNDSNNDNDFDFK